MSTLESLNLGVVGAARRGGRLLYASDVLDSVRVHAVCDTDPDGLYLAKTDLGAYEAYHDYEEMLDRSELDAVVIGTPMPLHVPQAIAALERHIHVLSEVPAGVSVDECRDLVQAWNRSRATYMMAENYIYTRQNQTVKQIAREGLFGALYYAEGEYIHELKPESTEGRPWGQPLKKAEGAPLNLG